MVDCVKSSQEEEFHLEKLRALLYSSAVKFDKESLKNKQGNGRFDASDVKRFIEKSNELFALANLQYCETQTILDPMTVAYEVVVALMEMFPALMMEMKRNVDEQLQLQMDWVTTIFESIKRDIDKC